METNASKSTRLLRLDDAIDEEMLEYIAVRKDSEPDEIG